MKKHISIFHRIIFLFLFSFFSAPGFAQMVFDFNANSQQAYKEIIQLKLSSGQQMLDAEKKIHPNNLIPYFLENYIDFFTLFFNEDPAAFELKEANEGERLRLMSKGSESSPFYLFTKSIIHFQWAAIKIKFGNNWNAGWEFRRSFLQGKENQEKFPGFLPNAMLNGTMQVAAGTIPDGYKWLSNLLGIKGSIKTGMQQLEQFLGQKTPSAILYREETVFYYLYLKFYIENKKEDVFTFITQNKLDVTNNHLFAYLAANLGVNGQRSDYAENILLQKNNSPDYFDMPVWDLEIGYVKLNHLEPDADIYLKLFIEKFKGRFYVKDVLQKLSWFYYLQGNQQKANEYRGLVLKKGGTETEADKQAQKEAIAGIWPDKLLLKARLLNDGGYFNEALKLLQGKGSADFSSPADKLEFAYRLGRIYDDTGRKEEAITAYLTVIKLGVQSREYYAARAALQAGYIYEKLGDKKTACAYFQKCIDMKDHDYKNSLDQKAKAGIARCKNE
jgi:predicted negative regulator of RcsB-dependent stress response